MPQNGASHLFFLFPLWRKPSFFLVAQAILPDWPAASFHFRSMISLSFASLHISISDRYHPISENKCFILERFGGWNISRATTVAKLFS
jgi:hypothetical protein